MRRKESNLSGVKTKVVRWLDNFIIICLFSFRFVLFCFRVSSDMLYLICLQFFRFRYISMASAFQFLHGAAQTHPVVGVQMQILF